LKIELHSVFVTLHTIAFSRKYENLYLDTLEASVCIKTGRLLFTHNPSNLEGKTEIRNSNSAVSSLPYLDGVCEADHHARVAHDDLRCTYTLEGGLKWELPYLVLAIVKHAYSHLKFQNHI
jgi:hypothetical protein